MTSLESVPEEVTFVVGDSKILFSTKSLTSGPLKDTFLSVLYLTPLGKRENKNVIKIEEPVDPYYVRIIAKFADTGLRSDIPWNDPNFDIDKLCQLADKWVITSLLTALGCEYLPKKSTQDEIKYILKRMPVLQLESGTFMLCGTTWTTYMRGVNIIDNKLKVTMLVQKGSSSIREVIEADETDLKIADRALNLFVDAGDKLNKITQRLKDSDDVLDESAKKYESYEHAIFMLNILTNFDRTSLDRVLRYNLQRALEESTQTAASTYDLLQKLKATKKEATEGKAQTYGGIGLGAPIGGAFVPGFAPLT